MNRCKLIFQIGFVSMGLMLMSVGPVYAYLDPGTGSYIFQMLVASILGGLYALKVYWTHTKLFFINLFSRSKKQQNNTED